MVSRRAVHRRRFLVSTAAGATLATLGVDHAARAAESDAAASPGLQLIIERLADVRRRMSNPGALTPVEQFRAVCDTIMPGEGPIDATVTPARRSPVGCEWLCAPGANPRRRILMLHAGSFIAYARQSLRRYAAWISAATGASMLLLDYRLAPEHPYPAAPNDVHTAYLWMRRNGPTGRGRADQIWVMGDSAGGTLALALPLMLRDRQQPQPDAIVAVSPWLDMTGSAASYETRAKTDPLSSRKAVMGSAAIYLAGADAREPYASPLFGDLSGLPPALILVGDAEVILDDSTRFAAKAKAAGSPVEIEVWPRMIHCWPEFAAVLPEGRAAIDRMGVYLRTIAAARPS